MKNFSTESLATLLRDDDPSVITLVKEQLYEQGLEDIVTLRGMSGSGDILVDQHLNEVIARIEHELFQEEFLLYCHGFPLDGDLEDACWKLAKLSFTGSDEKQGRKLLDEWAGVVNIRLSQAKDTLAGINILADFLTRDLGFKGNTQNYYHTDNNYINRVLETRCGIPISLSLIYLLIGRRLNLPLKGIGMPGHFICAWNNVYFDPFKGGKVLHREECVNLCKEFGYTFQDHYLNPISNKFILARMINNLQYVYEMGGQHDHHLLMMNYLNALQA
ncbi:MAG: transglutaminase-like domain-containing protein [Verrucomicrobiota bacterium]|nr:transglutaminase-like domain-containing protein [Verrucomicrobiota bacterium]